MGEDPAQPQKGLKAPDRGAPALMVSPGGGDQGLVEKSTAQWASQGKTSAREPWYPYQAVPIRKNPSPPPRAGFRFLHTSSLVLTIPTPGSEPVPQ